MHKFKWPELPELPKDRQTASLVLAAVAGILIFLIISAFFIFKTGLFAILYNAGKPFSHAVSARFENHDYKFLVMLGQTDLTQANRNTMSGYGTYHLPGVVVDRSDAAHNKIYVVDSGNNRILGYKSFDPNGNVLPDIVLGQPDLNHGACNGDANSIQSPVQTSYTSFCLGGFAPDTHNTAEQWGKFSPDVDTQGNLYVPDRFNSRVLEFYKPLTPDPTGCSGHSGCSGDTIADQVWGQVDSSGSPSFTNFGPNQVPFATDSATPGLTTATTLNFTTDTTGTSAPTDWGVGPDNSGGIWVTDTYNNRILHFSANQTAADIELGQPVATSVTAAQAMALKGCHNSDYNHLLSYIQNPSSANGDPNGYANLSGMCTPQAVKYDSVHQKLYVLDSFNQPSGSPIPGSHFGFTSRILVFNGPTFTSGQQASRVVLPISTDPTAPASGKYVYEEGSNITLNSDLTDFPTGAIWIDDAFNRWMLLDQNGVVKKVVGAVDTATPAGYPSGCKDSSGHGLNTGDPTKFYYQPDDVHQVATGGSLGLDSSNNVYLPDENRHRISRYRLADYNWNVPIGVCPQPNGGLYPGTSQNLSNADSTNGVLNGMLTPSNPIDTSASIGNANGIAIFQNQLITFDEGNLIKVWNNYNQATVGQKPDFVINDQGAGVSYLNNSIDKYNRLWIEAGGNKIQVYQLPFTSNNQQPVAKNVGLVWTDDGQNVNADYGGGNIAYDSLRDGLWFTDASNHRLLFIKNYNDIANSSVSNGGNLKVNLLVGQYSKTMTACNHNQSYSGGRGVATGSPVDDGFCMPTQIQFDHTDQNTSNLYVVEGTYECQGNARISIWPSSGLTNWANLTATNSGTLYSADTSLGTNNLRAVHALVGSLNSSSPRSGDGALGKPGPCANGTLIEPGAPTNISLNGANQLVVSGDGSYGSTPLQNMLRPTRQLWIYANPLTDTLPEASIKVPAGTVGGLVTDSTNSLYIRDGNWYRIIGINPNLDPGTAWFESNNGADLPSWPAPISQTQANLYYPFNATLSVNNGTAGNYFVVDATTNRPAATSIQALWDGQLFCGSSIKTTDASNNAHYGLTCQVPMTASTGTHTVTIESNDLTDKTLLNYNVLVASTPYSGSAINVPGTVPAANFDNGGEGVAYHDTTPTSNGLGTTYRSTTVDVGGPLIDGNYYVGQTAPGEWLQYTVNVTQAGNYSFQAKLACACYGTTSPPSFHVEIDGLVATPVIQYLVDSSHSNWNDYQPYPTTPQVLSTLLSTGLHHIRIFEDNGIGNIESFSLSYIGTPSPSPSGSPSDTACNGTRLSTGQVALYSGTNYTGSCMIVSNGYYSKSVTSPTRYKSIQLNTLSSSQILSIKVGPSTTAQLNTDPFFRQNSSFSSLTTQSSIPNLTATSLGTLTSAVSVQSTTSSPTPLPTATPR